MAIITPADEMRLKRIRQMQRAVAEARKAGYACVPAGVHLVVLGFDHLTGGVAMNLGGLTPMNVIRILANIAARQEAGAKPTEEPKAEPEKAEETEAAPETPPFTKVDGAEKGEEKKG